MRHGVSDNEPLQAAVVDVGDGVAGEDAVSDDGIDLAGTMLHNRVGSLHQRAARVGHVVDDDGNLVLNVSDEDHSRDLVGARSFLVNQSERQIQAVRNGSCPEQEMSVDESNFCRTQWPITAEVDAKGLKGRKVPFCTASIRTDDHAILDIQILANPLQHARFRIKVVDRHVEEALNLAGMQIHGDDMLRAGDRQHVGDESCRNGSSALILLVLSGIEEIGDDRGNASGRSCLAGIDHDQQLHKIIVDVVGTGGL